MPRIATPVLAIVGVTVAVIALVAVLDRTPKAFTLGVPAEGPAAPLKPDQTVCQQPIDVAAGAEFDAVRAQIGTYGKPGAALAVTVQDLAGRVIARGRQPGGYGDVAVQPTHRIALDHTVGAGRISVCIRDTGTSPVALYGAGDLAARSSTASLDGRALTADVALSFERRPRSYASLVTSMFERAALFRFPWTSALLYWLVGAALVFVAPALLLLALRAAVKSERT
jgi:hypothetical protein